MAGNANFGLKALGNRSFLFCALLAAGAASGTRVWSQDYHIGPQDKLKIAIVEWRAGTANAFQWEPLSGEFSVSAAGNLSLPVIGTIPVAGKTVEEVSSDLSSRLQRAVGMQNPPSASVEVSEYRPFFVAGLAAKPGKYPFVPGLKVVEAISIAGGFAGPVDNQLLALQRQVLEQRGVLRELEVERLSLVARDARLQAVIDGSEKVAFPAELVAKATDPAIARLIETETKLFDGTTQSIKAESEALQRARDFASTQIDVLKSKETNLKEQSSLADKELGNINKLVTQGVTAANRIFGAAQYVSELQSRSLDVSMALISAKQSVAKTDREIVSIREKYRIDALNQQGEVRDKLAANLQKGETARALLENLEAHAPQASATVETDLERPLVISIIRTRGGETVSMPVSEDAEVLPGDVVQIERQKPAAVQAVNNGLTGKAAGASN